MLSTANPDPLALPTTAISFIGSADYAVFEVVQALDRTDEDLAGELGAFVEQR